MQQAAPPPPPASCRNACAGATCADFMPYSCREFSAVLGCHDECYGCCLLEPPPESPPPRPPPAPPESPPPAPRAPPPPPPVRTPPPTPPACNAACGAGTCLRFRFVRCDLLAAPPWKCRCDGCCLPAAVPTGRAPLGVPPPPPPPPPPPAVPPACAHACAGATCGAFGMDTWLPCADFERRLGCTECHGCCDDGGGAAEARPPGAASPQPEPRRGRLKGGRPRGSLTVLFVLAGVGLVVFFALCGGVYCWARQLLCFRWGAQRAPMLRTASRSDLPFADLYPAHYPTDCPETYPAVAVSSPAACPAAERARAANTRTSSSSLSNPPALGTRPVADPTLTENPHAL